MIQTESTVALTDSEQCGLSPRWAKWIITVLLTLHVALAFDAARQWTVTHDEYWHLPVGLLNLQTGRFDYDALNPPALRMLAAVPVWLAGGEVGSFDRSDNTTDYGDRFFKANADNVQTMFLLGRCVIILTSVIGAILMACWCWSIGGPLAAVVAVIFWTTDPTILANSALVTTDLGAAVFFSATLFALWRFAHKPTARRAAIFGLLLGTAQLIKFTCVLLFLIAVPLWFIVRFRNRSITTSSRMRIAGMWGLALGIALFCWNAGYLSHGSFARLDDYDFLSHSMQSISSFFWGGIPVPLPHDYMVGLDHQRAIMESVHPVFLDGVWKTHFGQYYIMALLYKLPHSTQFLLGLATFTVFVPVLSSRHFRLHLFLLLPTLLLLVLASVSSMQLGIRYVLPIFPLLFAWAAIVLSSIARKNRISTAALLVVVGLSIFSLRHHPHHLGYFNWLAGGSDGGMYHLLDSNVDWGQDLRLLQRYVEEQEIEEIRLAYFGTVSPRDIGLQHRLPARRGPEAGWHAVSVNFLMGRPHMARDRDNKFQAVGPYEFSYFRWFKERKKIGSSIFVYRLTKQDVRRFYENARQNK